MRDLALVGLWLGRLRGQRLLLALVLLALVDQRGRAVLHEHVHDLVLVSSLGQRDGRVALVVDYVGPGSLDQQQLDHVHLAVLDCVEERRLAVVVGQVQVRVVVQQTLDGLQSALPAGVEDGVLPVGVDVVHVAAVGDQPLGELQLALPAGVVERRLAERVHLRGVDAHLLEHVAHLGGQRVVGDHGAGEDQVLLEVSVVVQLAALNAAALDLGHHLVDVALLDEGDQMVDQLLVAHRGLVGESGHAEALETWSLGVRDGGALLSSAAL